MLLNKDSDAFSAYVANQITSQVQVCDHLSICKELAEFLSVVII